MVAVDCYEIIISNTADMAGSMAQKLSVQLWRRLLEQLVLHFACCVLPALLGLKAISI